MQGSMQQNGEQSPILLPQSNEHGTNGQTGHTGHVNVASVITQVTHAGPPVPYRATFQAEPSSSKPVYSWRSRLQSLICCFGVPNQGYVRENANSGGAGPVARIQQPPIPPKLGREMESLIGPIRVEDAHKKTLVLDLDETLVHSSFKPIPSPDYIIPVEIDGKLVDVYVLKRPWLDHFMESIGHRFEVVVFTASLSKYADPLLDLLDKWHVVRWRLFRESCVPYEGNYVKDLSCMGRELSQTIIVDNSPHSYVFQPANALPISTFIDDMEDQELLTLLPILQQLETAEDVRDALRQHFTC